MLAWETRNGPSQLKYAPEMVEAQEYREMRTLDKKEPEGQGQIQPMEISTYLVQVLVPKRRVASQVKTRTLRAKYVLQEREQMKRKRPPLPSKGTTNLEESCRYLGMAGVLHIPQALPRMTQTSSPLAAHVSQRTPGS